MDPFWSYIATIDEKDRFVVPVELRKGLLSKAHDLYLVLSENKDFGKYIKLIPPEFVYKQRINPLTCDSFNIIKKYNCLNMPIAANGRITIGEKGRNRLLNDVLDPSKKVTCIPFGNHIVITAKTKEEILNLIS